MTTDASPIDPVLPSWAGGLAIGIVLIVAVALVFAFMVPDLETYLTATGRYGPLTVHGSINIPGLFLGVPLGMLCLWLAVRLPVTGGTT